MQSPQILTNRTKQGLQIWISQSALMRWCPTLSDGYLRKARCMNKSGKWSDYLFQKSCDTYYYEYASIPNKKPSMYASMLPTREELIELSNKPVIETDTTLEVEAKEYINENYKKYLRYYIHAVLENQANNLSKACAMLEWMIKYIESTDLDTRGMEFFTKCCELIKALDVRYLPDTAYRNLKYKVLDIISGNTSIVESVTLPRAGNDYAASHREDRELTAWIYQLRSSGANYSNAFIIRKVQQEAEKVGKIAPSDRWIGEILEQHETKYLTAEARFGANGKYANPYKMAIPTANALFAGDCWEIDATRVNIIPHKDSNKDLKYLTIVTVRDVHSGNPVGLAFDVSENRWIYSQALSNAVTNTGYLPYELRYDRFPGHNTEEVIEMFSQMEALGVKLTKVHKASGKQRLERWFGSMQQLALQNSPFYYGEGIMSNRKSAHRSKDYMQETKKLATQNGWDFDKAVNETVFNITSWVNTPYSQWSRKYKQIELSPVQMHEQSEKPNVIACNAAQHAFLFGLKKTLKIANGGLIRTTINHEEFVYQIEDFEVIKQHGEVICCYDVEDLSKVHLYAVGKQAMKLYLGVAKEFVPVQLYGTNPEYGRLSKVRALYNEFEKLKHDELQSKKVANSDMTFGNDYTVAQPMTVHKAVAETAESQVTNKHFGFDEGDNLNFDVTNQL